jgi:hypothetical protein
MCKEMPVIPVNKVVDPKRIIEKNGGPRRRSLTPPQKKQKMAGSPSHYPISYEANFLFNEMSTEVSLTYRT